MLSRLPRMTLLPGHMPVDPQQRRSDDRALMPSTRHDLTPDRLGRAPEPLAHHRRVVVPSAAAEEPDAVDAHTYFRVIPQPDQGLFGGNPAAAPASALVGLADRSLSL